MRLAAEAEIDLDEIWTFSELEWDRAQADRYAANIKGVIAGLLDFPAKGRQLDDLPFDMRVIRSGRHLIFYQVCSEEIFVVRVLHDRMDYRRHLR